MSETTENVPMPPREAHAYRLGAEESFHLLMENVQDFAIFFIDTDLRIRDWNIGAERILGFREEDIVGKPLSIIFTSEDIAAGNFDREVSIARENGRANDERWQLRKDGSVFWASGILTALRDENNDLRGYAKILRDFTSRKQAQETLLERQSDIEALNARLRRAVAETHHRVKNNLQVVAALVDIVSQKETDSVPVSEIKRVLQHIHSMAAIHSLLTEDTKADAQTDTLSAKAVLERLLPLLKATIPMHQITFEVEDCRLPLKQGTSLTVLVNELVGNAAKHGNSRIELHFQVIEGKARLIIRDDGSGFPSDFSPEKAANTGLELVESLARWDLQGETRYETDPQGGGRVTVIFPILTAP
jgi:PAS domain S-box-containing protein